MTTFGFLKELFKNYEVVKLHVGNHFLLNSLIYITLLLATVMTLRQKASTFLDFSQTESLKGLAMLFVVFGHFWYHVCNVNNPFLVFGDYAVTLFLLLSGYGLMVSNINCKVTTREFISKRLRKILVPYWLVTIAIIIADYVLLHRQYNFQELILTFSGINTSETLRYFDYARWFITLLLIYYIAFFFCAKLCSPPLATAGLVIFALFLILLRRNELFPLGARHQLLAFPLGCLIAVIGPIKYWDEVGVRRQISIILVTFLSVLSLYLVGTIDNQTDSYFIKKALTFLESYAHPYLFCILCVLSVSALSTAGYASKFLSLCGSLSYELYLIHGPLLIKYNPILGNFENRFVLIGLFLWFGVAIALAYTFKLSHQWLTGYFVSQKT